MDMAVRERLFSLPEQLTVAAQSYQLDNVSILVIPYQKKIAIDMALDSIYFVTLSLCNNVTIRIFNLCNFSEFHQGGPELGRPYYIQPVYTQGAVTARNFYTFTVLHFSKSVLP